MTNTDTTAVPYNLPREWMLWTGATIGGWLVGSAINVLLSIGVSMTSLGEALNADPANVPQSMALILMGVLLLRLFLIGASVGALQWLVLRRHVMDIPRWAILTGLGFAVGTFAYWPFMGLGVGLTQWLLLRRDLNKTSWWAVINAVAWPLGYLFGGGLGVTVGTAINSPLLGDVLSSILMGAIIGVLTGAMLMWLLRENAGLLESLRQEREAEQAKR